MPPIATRLLGAASIGQALYYNAAFAVLAARFDYPDILRQPVPEVMARFAAGGAGLILAWYALAFAAMLMVPLSLALALRGPVATPARIAAAILGALAGTVQAMGLLRWVTAVPALAELGPDAAPAFVALHQWGGVGIGEHLGFLFTAGFLLTMAAIDRARLPALIAIMAACLMVLGAAEGPVLALGANGEPFGLAAVAGYLGFSLWLIVTGLRLIRM